MIINKLGLEVEYLVKDTKRGTYVLASEMKLPHDVFPVLGEIRTRPVPLRGKFLIEEAVDELAGDLLGRLAMAKEKIRSQGFEMDISPDTRIRLKPYQQAIRYMKKHEDMAAKTKSNFNIYYPKINIDNLSDQIVKNGKIQGCTASCGFHIHFSSWYDPGPDAEPEKFSLLTVPVIRTIVEKLDKSLFVPYVEKKGLKGKTKFRYPGYFRTNEHGFEYRALAAYPEILAPEDALLTVLREAFDCFRLLDDLAPYGELEPGSETEEDDNEGDEGA